MLAADIERQVVSHYNLSNPFPTTWPSELDESDEEPEPRAGVRRSKSRYSALERAASDRRALIPGSQRTGDGKANLVQKDEQDPLDKSGSVMAKLRNRGVQVDQDLRTRNKFLLSSTTFSPALFLSHVHSDATTEDLVRGLQNLSESIDQKAQSLKVLVETNFERFVRAKATIDNVYSEMRNQGVNAAPTSPCSNVRHSRQVSRNSVLHGRNVSNSGVLTSPSSTQPGKHALRKETEYGIQGIKGPLLEVSQRAEDIWGPALGGKEREASLKTIVDAVERDRQLYELGGDLSTAIGQKNYEKAVELHSTARKYAADATIMAENAAQTNSTLSDDQVHKILVTGRMWMDVQEQAKLLKKEVWKRLTNPANSGTTVVPGQADGHMELIAILLELGVDDSPIWVWLLSRYDNLKNKINSIVDRSKVEIEILRRRLATRDARSPDKSAIFLRHAALDTKEDHDDEQVIEFWRTLLAYATKLLSTSSGLLGEILDFWDSAQSFIKEKKQNLLPSGYQGESRKHHKLSDSNVKDLQNGIVDLVNVIRDALYALFAETPADDLSAWFSPTVSSSQTPNTPFSTAFSPSDGRVGNIDALTIPALSTQKDESWNELAFWAPHSNALSAVHFLGQILVLLGAGSGEMMALVPISNNNQAQEKIKTMVSAARERCLRAVCEAWSKDAENCKYLEDWVRASDNRNQTKLPAYFSSYERYVLAGMQQVLFFMDNAKKSSSREIVLPPTAKLLQMIRTQFVSSIYKALSGMLENAETPPGPVEDEWTIVAESIQNASFNGSIEMASQSFDAKSRNIRMLLTLSNLKALRNDQIPSLIQIFESSFSVKLTDESKTIKDVFGQVDAKLFHSYTKPTAARLTTVIKDGINSPLWAPKVARPNQVSPYVYVALMILVGVHTEVSTTVTNVGTSNSTSIATNTTSNANTATLLTEILTHLLETVSQALLDGFKERKPNIYTLSALIQATLDTEFIDQTMSQYASSKAREIQNNIYVELDKRTTNDARANLQKELGEMRVVLKTLREKSRNSFGCFKRVRTTGAAVGEKEKVAATGVTAQKGSI